MTIDLHGDALVRVADAVADDLGTDIVVSVVQPRGQKPRCRQLNKLESPRQLPDHGE